MSIPEETLMAYVDGELDPIARTEVETAMRDDPHIASRVAQHRELRARIELAYAPDLAEPVPERLLAAAGSAGRKTKSKIFNLGQARAAIASKPSHVQSRKPRWRTAASMAASLLIGVGVGFFAWRQSESIMIRNDGGVLIAGEALARSLSSQLSADRSSASDVQIGLSFLTKAGEYCRTFTIVNSASSSGLACQHAKRWEIQVLAQSGSTKGGGSQFRTASSSPPPAIVSAIEQQISGDPLDRTAEIAARKKQWQGTGR